ncbi:MAG: hypothetical protein Q9162_004094 [Coniocarpon cinnabarinum]
MSAGAYDVEALLEEAAKDVKASDKRKAEEKRKNEEAKRLKVQREIHNGIYQRRGSDSSQRRGNGDFQRRGSDNSDRPAARGRGYSRERERERRHDDRSAERRRRNASKPDLMSNSPGGRGRDRDSFRAARMEADADRDRAYRNHWANSRPMYRDRGRSRSPSDRYYRPPGDRSERGQYRERENDLEREFEREANRQRERERDRQMGAGPRAKKEPSRSPPPQTKKPKQSPEPALTEDERDRRTVFVQQLAARLRTKELIDFFTKAGPVKEAQIVRDRVSKRSKGVGYVEFRNEESVQVAIGLTGQKLLGIPIIAQLTEAEKNRQARKNSNSGGSANTAPYHRLYVGNIHFSVTEEDVKSLFEPFGDLEFVQLHVDENQRSRGFGFVQFTDPEHAKEALEKMNNFEVAGRAIRVGLGNDKFTPESTQTLLQKFGQPDTQKYTGSSFSGSGGRGSHAGGAGGNFDRAGGRDDKKGTGASALDDTDVTSVNFNNFSRDTLMKKLARAEDNFDSRGRSTAKPTVTPAAPEPAKSRCMVLKGMFDPATEEGSSWVKELEEDVRVECNQKYGRVVHVSVDPNSQGDIYIAFDKLEGGDAAYKSLQGRFFGGRPITASFIVEAIYKTNFPKAGL